MTNLRAEADIIFPMAQYPAKIIVPLSSPSVSLPRVRPVERRYFLSGIKETEGSIFSDFELIKHRLHQVEIKPTGSSPVPSEK